MDGQRQENATDMDRFSEYALVQGKVQLPTPSIDYASQALSYLQSIVSEWSGETI